MEFVVLPLLILLNAIFAMSEVALLTARKARLQRMVADGDRAAAAALAMGENPNRFIRVNRAAALPSESLALAGSSAHSRSASTNSAS